jgi:multisubunit Na+/H+ antiporter MnhE subunit
LGAWVSGWIAAVAVYLLLIDTTDLPELVVGAGAAALAAFAFVLGREQYVLSETIRGRWFIRAGRPLARVPADMALLAWALIRQLRHPRRSHGVFRAVPFRCREEESLRVGRWALAESLGSFAPNTIVVGVDPERELILAHQLRRSGGAEAIDVLGLGR